MGTQGVAGESAKASPRTYPQTPRPPDDSAAEAGALRREVGALRNEVLALRGQLSSAASASAAAEARARAATGALAARGEELRRLREEHEVASSTLRAVRITCHCIKSQHPKKSVDLCP